MIRVLIVVRSLYPEARGVESQEPRQHKHRSGVSQYTAEAGGHLVVSHTLQMPGCGAAYPVLLDTLMLLLGADVSVSVGYAPEKVRMLQQYLNDKNRPFKAFWSASPTPSSHLQQSRCF